jgi:hypothetical protein
VGRLRESLRGTLKQRRRGRLQMVPIALPPGDLAACPGLLESQGVCRAGDILVVDASSTIVEAGRCERYPEGTRTWAFTNPTFNLALQKAVDLIPDFPKRVQSIVLFSSFKQTAEASVPPGKAQSCPLAYHFKLYNDVWGIGQKGAPPPAGQVFTSVTNMWSMLDWTDADWFDVSDDDRPLGILSHEVEHDVCCYVRFQDPVTGSLSSELIGQQGAHWSLYHNTYGQLMYGANWREEGNGTFYSIKPAAGLRPLDLYLWGLIPPEQVPPVYLVDTKGQTCTPKQQTLDALAKDCAEMPLDASTRCKDDFSRCLTRFDLCLDPPYYRTLSGGCEPHAADEVQSPTGLTARGKKRWVTIEQIVEATGKRLPDWTRSYKVNTHLFTLLTGGEPLDNELVDRVDRFRRAWQRYHYGITGFRMRMRTTHDGAEDMPLWEWGGSPECPGCT